METTGTPQETTTNRTVPLEQWELDLMDLGRQMKACRESGDRLGALGRAAQMASLMAGAGNRADSAQREAEANRQEAQQAAADLLRFAQIEHIRARLGEH